MSFFKMNINLSAFQHVLMTTKKGTKGIFIPIELNNIKPSKDGKNLYVNFIAFKMKAAKEWATHMIKQSFSKEERDKMTEEEEKSQPIFGNAIIEQFDPSGTNNDVAGGKVFNDDDDDLPF